MLVLFLLQGAAEGGFAAGTLRLETSTVAMGSTYSLVLYGEDRERLEAAAADAFAEAHRLDNLLSNYKPGSEWSQMNRLAAEKPFPVSAELFGLLTECANYSRSSAGAFDISVGPLMQVWGFYKGTGHLPGREQIETALQSVGYERVALADSSHTVAFERTGMNLDPGGIGKGYAVDRMVGILKNDGISTALVQASNSSIYCLGAPPDKEGWTIGIQNPRNTAELSAKVVLKDESLSTSGSSEKFFVAEGKTYSHIMDPRTGYPAQGALSVSVIAPRTIDSEAWAKPYFINGRQWTASHKPRQQRVFYCEDKANQPCAWLP